MIELRAGELEASVQGGELLTVTSLRHRGEELLVEARDMPPGYSVHRRRAGITLLHPWANRLGDDAYVVSGVAARVPAGDPAVSRDAGGLPLHGLALPDAWSVTAAPEAGHDAVLARASFTGHPAFPFAHDVLVRLALHPLGLTVTTELQAGEQRAVPIAFGWHPYFRLPAAPRPEWMLELPARRHVVCDDRGIPVAGGSRPEPPERAPLADRAFDDGYEGLEAGAVMAVSGGGRLVSVRLDEGYRAAQVFAPSDVAVVSLEPMTAITDSLRSGRGLRFVEPGETVRAVFSVGVQA